MAINYSIVAMKNPSDPESGEVKIVPGEDEN